MKSFVSKDLTLSRSSGPGGRVRWLPDLWSIVLPIVGAVVFAEFLGLIETGELLKFILAGPTFGAVIGRSVVVWREWGGSELPSEQVRRIECLWILAGTAVALLLCLLA